MAQKHDFCPEMLSALKNANSILLCTHAQPDGDAIGSTLAMGLALRSLGKRVTLLAHLATTDYLDRDHISTGYQRIDRSSKTDLNLQLRWRF